MSDPRFSRLKSDPRFRRPKKKQAKVLIDDRFKSVFASENKQKSARVDKYGRPLNKTHDSDNLKRFYRLEDTDADEQPSAITDFARGEVLLESSDEEDEKSSQENSEQDGSDRKRPITIHDQPLVEIDLDEGDLADLEAQAAAYAQANPESADQHDEATPTCRLAAVNLDWDHVRAIHLFKICSSLLSYTTSAIPSTDKKGASSGGIARGRVLSVRVYPSQFGKERMAREEREGPPQIIFKKKDHDDEVNAENIYDVRGEEEYDEDALRNYQLERLRYYYAIITCDSEATSSQIYQELEGTELERSANVFNLSYVPDDMSFDGDFRDEATQTTDTMFKTLDFVTDALRHSKVKLTWDDDDPERNHVTRRALTQKEIEDGDFRAYLASSSESENDATGVILNTQKGKKRSRDRLRALLLVNNDDVPEGWDREIDPQDIDMEITFTPGLSEDKKDETSLDSYRRKLKEKRQKRKETQTMKAGSEEHPEQDDFFDMGNDNGDSDQREPPARLTSTAEELSLLSSNDAHSEPQHFNLKAVLKAEKKVRLKERKKKGGKVEHDNEIQADFKIDVNDERFKVLHEDHQYAIDPTNPQFKKTEAMTAFLHERSRRQQVTFAESSVSNKQRHNSNEEKALSSLVESIKRKSADTFEQKRKRRKV
ncbi:hypothetical protein H0H93_015183 [Arthromyces matolae]|nr:hypothetical protein H0H93_015183 [Arthromyces matolae]